jgi:signal transduction histidine kinase
VSTPRNRHRFPQLHHYARQSQRVVTRLAEVEDLKQGFLRTVNHELRTPLTSIGSYLQPIQDGGLDTATEHKFLEVIERNSDRIRHLIDELLPASLTARTAACRSGCRRVCASCHSAL